MRVVNTMFGCGLGGIEQAFIDYTEALLLERNHVTAITQPQAQILGTLEGLRNNPLLRIERVRNMWVWDLLAVHRLRQIMKEAEPDVVVTHGGRAASLMQKAAAHLCPVIGVAHNYSTKRLLNLDAVFAITEDIAAHVTQQGFPESRIHVVPNMIAMPETLPAPRTAYRDPPVIGTMGRAVKKKGFDVFIRALGALHEKGVAFHAVIGGEGEELKALEALCTTLGISDHVHFPGWVKNKATFFDMIDIFCLPSLHEPFGIVLLEAFLHGVPVVTSDSEGPREIATHGKNALVTAKGDVDALAKQLRLLMHDPALGQKLSTAGVDTVKERYDIQIVAGKLHTCIEQVVK